MTRFCRALSRIVEYNCSSDKSDTAPVMPICMAPCCHSICEWADCFYQSFFTTLGFTQEDYTAIVIVSQWGTISLPSPGPDTESDSTTNMQLKRQRTTEDSGSIGKGLVLTRHVLATLKSAAAILEAGDNGRRDLFTSNAIIGDSVQEEQALLQLSSEEFESRLSKENKRRLGIACKELIDISRGVGLIAAGYCEVELVRYTQSSVENLLICAK
jgi:hypothetical protein